MVNDSTTLDAAFRALADPTRRAILHRLTDGPASVTDLAAPYDMGLPGFLKHIAVLEAGDLVESRKEGRVRICALKPGRLSEAQGWFAAQIALWEGRTARLAAFVEDSDSEESLR